MTTNPRPYAAPVDPAPACEHQEFDGEYRAERDGLIQSIVRVRIWCRSCLRPVVWTMAAVSQDPTVATLYCRPLGTTRGTEG